MTREYTKPTRPKATIQPGIALIAASVLLPAILFAFAAWLSYREILREAEIGVERTARLLEEHALNAFETDRLIIDQINGRIRFMDWSRFEDRLDLHNALGKLQKDLDQISTISVTDADGYLRVSGQSFPADPTISYADRDWFQTAKAADLTFPFVSRSYIGRLSGNSIFNLAARMRSGPDGAFTGAIAISVDRKYFERFYRTIDPTIDHSVLLVRNDGYVLASEPVVPFDRLPDTSALRHQITIAPAGSYTMLSQIDHVERIFAYRKVGAYPVFVRFGLSKASALEPWRQTVVNYGLVAFLASAMLIAASLFAGRQMAREQVARRLWEDMAEALKAEALVRERIEQQLRQSQKMEAVGRLTGGVAHDFNNLLTAVIGSLDLVLRRPTGRDERTTRLIGNALEGAHRAAALTARLLAFSRQQPLQPVRVEAGQLVEGMSDLLRRTLGETIIVETRQAVDLWPTLADPNQLENAILNLAVNARDAMPDGGRLLIETANADLDALYSEAHADVEAGAYVMISVSDTGSGMTPEVIANAFEPFFTTKEIGKGTGLGLSQVYGFATQSGGHVAVESMIGQGSTFRLYLPRLLRTDRPDIEAPSVAAVQPIEGANGQTILVVEDEPMVRQLSVAILEEAGYRVFEAEDGPTALEIARRHGDIALLFTDVVLGGPMNGRVLADRIREERPDLPVLFTTGYTPDAIMNDGRLEDDLNVIGKPFTGAILVKKVNELMKERVS